MKIAIVYISVHHKNTEKIVKAIAEVSIADLFDLTKDKDIDLLNYEVVGIASGIYAGNMHKSMLRFIDLHKLPKKVFIVFTSVVTFINYANKMYL